MMNRYVKPLGQYINEAANMAETTFKTEQKKYDDAIAKDKLEYQKYTDGTITKEQYLSSFEALLQVEQTFRRAQIAYKLESARGPAQQQQNKEKQQLPGSATAQPTVTSAGSTPVVKPPLPG